MCGTSFVCVCVHSRVGVYVNTFQSLAGHQEKFHGEMSKVSGPVQSNGSSEDTDRWLCTPALFASPAQPKPD